MIPTIIRAAACAAILIFLMAASTVPVERYLAQRAAVDSLRLVWTAPCNESVSTGCSPALAPISDLDHYEIGANFGTDTLVIATRAAGAPCASEAITIARPSAPRVFCRYVDHVGNRACWSGPVPTDGTTGVPVDWSPAWPDTVARLYDIAGRRVMDARRSGVYFIRRPGERVGRMVVVK